MSEENINTNEQLDLDELDEASGGFSFRSARLPSGKLFLRPGGCVPIPIGDDESMLKRMVASAFAAIEYSVLRKNALFYKKEVSQIND